MTFEKLGEDLPPIWEPEKGESIEGIYKGKQLNVGENKSAMYTIEVDGELKNFWGSKVIDGKMLYVKEEELDEIRKVANQLTAIGFTQKGAIEILCREKPEGCRKLLGELEFLESLGAVIEDKVAWFLEVLG